MIKQQKLEELIREKVPLGNPDSRGFYCFRCPLCNDYKVRAGFKFDNNQVGYNCWNCSTSSVYEEFGQKISKKMRSILNAFGIEDSEISNVVNSAFFNKKEEPTQITLGALTKINTQTPPVKMPPNSFRIGSTDLMIDMQERIVQYLSKRCIDFDRYTFWFSTEPRFKDRVIIPFYRNGQQIYWQARSINDDEKKRYDNCVASREAVMFNMDELTRYSPAPLLICEGVFDAMMFDSLALLGSKLTPAKFELLKQSRRRLVFVIDKDRNGKSLADVVLKLGYEITFAPEGAADINKAVQRFGRTWTAMQLIKNIPMDDTAAQIAIGLNCV